MGVESNAPEQAAPSSLFERDIDRRAFIRRGLKVIGGIAAADVARRVDPFGLTKGVKAKSPDGLAESPVEFEVTHIEYFTDVDETSVTGNINTALREKIQHNPILAAQFRRSDEYVGQIDTAEEAIEPVSRVYLPFAKRSGNGPVITQTPGPTEAPLPTHTPPLPTATNTPNPTEIPVPPTATPEGLKVIEQDWPLPEGAPLLDIPHSVSTWTTAEHAQAQTGTVVDILENGMVTVLITDPYDGTKKTVFANPADIRLDPKDIDKGMIDVPLVVREIVSPTNPVRINATDGSYRAEFPGNQMRNGIRPVDFHFDMTLEPKPGSTDATAAFRFASVTYDSSSNPIKSTGCSVQNRNGQLYLLESNYDYRTGKRVENSYDLKVAGMRTDAILRVTEGKTLTFFLPEWDDTEQKYYYKPHITVPLSAPIEESSVWNFGPGALDATAIYDKVTMTAISDIDNIDAFVPDPTRNKETIKEYLPDHKIDITEPEPTELPRMNNIHVMRNADIVGLADASYGYNKWRLGTLLLGRPQDGIRGFPFNTIQKADFNGQTWNPSIDGTGINDVGIPPEYKTKEGRDTYIRAVINFALARGNHEAFILDNHFDNKGNVVNDWIGTRAGTAEQTKLLVEQITTTHDIDPDRGIRFKLPRNFSLSDDNTARLFDRIDAAKNAIEQAGGDAKIEGIHIYPQGSSPREIQQFLLNAQNRGITVHAFGLADRSQNRILGQQSTPIEVMEAFLDHYDAQCVEAHKAGGPDAVAAVQTIEFNFDSDHVGGLDDSQSPEGDTRFLIERKDNLEYRYGPLHDVVLQFVKDRHLSKAA